MPATDTRKIAKAQAAFQRQSRATLPKCSNAFIMLVSKTSLNLKAVPITCHKWSCPHCRTVRLAQAKLKATAGRPERHIVLTIPGDRVGSTPYLMTYIRKQFSLLVARIRREFGKFEYMAVLELHKSGRPHLHVLTRGSYMPWRWLKEQWHSLTGAWMVHIGTVTNSTHAVNELVKYLAKTAARLAEEAPGKPIMTVSNGWVIDKPPGLTSWQPNDWTPLFYSARLSDLAELASALGYELRPEGHPARIWSLIPTRDPPDDAADRCSAIVGYRGSSLFDLLIAGRMGMPQLEVAIRSYEFEQSYEYR